MYASYFVPGGVGLDDVLHQRMTDDVNFRKMNEADAVNFSQNVFRFNQSGFFILRQVHLGNIARDDRFGAEAQSC